MKRLPAGQNNRKIHRERDISALSRLILLLVCGLALTVGFLFAARQHFAAIQYGYKSQDLRAEQKRLLEEQRRLQLLKEEAVSPVRLEPAARKIGLQAIQPAQIAARKEAKVSASNPAIVINSAASLPR